MPQSRHILRRPIQRIPGAKKQDILQVLTTSVAKNYSVNDSSFSPKPFFNQSITRTEGRDARLHLLTGQTTYSTWKRQTSTPNPRYVECPGDLRFKPRYSRQVDECAIAPTTKPPLFLSLGYHGLLSSPIISYHHQPLTLSLQVALLTTSPLATKNLQYFFFQIPD